MTTRKTGWLEDMHPSGQLIATAGVALFTGIVVTLLGLLLALPFLGDQVLQLMGEGTDLSHPDNIHLGRYMQIISHLGLFILSSFLLAWLFGRRIFQYLYLNRFPRIEIYLLSALVIFAALPLINYILELNMQMHLPKYLQPVEEWMRRTEAAAERTTLAFLRVDTISGLFFNLFMIAVIPALGEELMFRGVIQRIFLRWSSSTHIAVWTSALIFSAIHLQFFGFFPRMILGALFGYMVVWSGSIWPAILAHFVNNAAAVIAFYLFHHQLTDDTLQNIGKGNDGIYLALLSLLVTLALLVAIRRLGRKG